MKYLTVGLIKSKPDLIPVLVSDLFNHYYKIALTSSDPNATLSMFLTDVMGFTDAVELLGNTKLSKDDLKKKMDDIITNGRKYHFNNVIIDPKIKSCRLYHDPMFDELTIDKFDNIPDDYYILDDDNDVIQVDEKTFNVLNDD